VDALTRQLLGKIFCIPTIKHISLYIQTWNLKSTSEMVFQQIS